MTTGILAPTSGKCGLSPMTISPSGLLASLKKLYGITTVDEKFCNVLCLNVPGCLGFNNQG